MSDTKSQKSELEKLKEEVMELKSIVNQLRARQVTIECRGPMVESCLPAPSVQPVRPVKEEVPLFEGESLAPDEAGEKVKVHRIYTQKNGETKSCDVWVEKDKAPPPLTWATDEEDPDSWRDDGLGVNRWG